MEKETGKHQAAHFFCALKQLYKQKNKIIIMKLPKIAKKAAVIIVCILIAYSLVSYIMLLFIGSFTKSVIAPMTYANINFMNCEMREINDNYINNIISQRCDFMTLSRPCSINGLKNLANNMPIDKSRQNTGFLTDVVFLGYQDSIRKDTCKIKEFENFHDKREGSLYTPSLFWAIVIDHTVIHPQKQTFSANIAISLDIRFLTAVEAIMTAWTRGISNEFKEKCLLDSEICDQKYHELYEILTENIIEIARDESAERNITYKKASPLHEGDDLYLLFNNFLYASEENDNWKNPVSNMTFTLISEIGNLYAIQFEHKEKTGQISDHREVLLSEMDGIPLNVIQECAYVMAIAATKSASIAGLTQGIKDKCEKIEEKYVACMNDINCTKEVFQSKKYQNCIITCDEIIDSEFKKYVECRNSCNTIDCDDICGKIEGKYEKWDSEYPSCINECYYGDLNE